MEIYKHKIYINGKHITKSDLKFFNEDRKVVTNNKHKYEVVRFEEVVDDIILLQYSRAEQVFKEGNLYYERDETSTTGKKEITEEQYAKFLEEYNYFNIFDHSKSVLFTTNTTNKKTIINIEVLSKFFKKDINFETVSEVQIKKELLKIKPTEIKLYYDKLHERRLPGFTDKFEEQISMGLQDDLNMKSAKVILKNFNGNKLSKAGIKRMIGLLETGKNFEIQGFDEASEKMSISNLFINKAIIINGKKSKNPEEIYVAITNYFRNVYKNE